MFQSMWEDLRRAFDSGNMITRLIIANVAVFVLVWAVYLLLLLSIGHNGGHDVAFDKFVTWFCMPADRAVFLRQPWSLFTNIFLHTGLFHILWNMLFLYWFGRIVGDLLGDHRVLPIYLLGGLAGTLLFFLVANVFHTGTYVMGASGAVMAFVVIAGLLAPDYEVRLLLLGNIRLKFIVITLLVLDVMQIIIRKNTGGHIAHLGGAAMGLIFVYQLKAGHDWSVSVNRLLNYLWRLFRRVKGTPVRPNVRVAHRNPVKVHADTQRKSKPAEAHDMDEATFQKRIDAILDKIKQSGYDSLSAEEKEFLFNASRRP